MVVVGVCDPEKVHGVPLGELLFGALGLLLGVGEGVNEVRLLPVAVPDLDPVAVPVVVTVGDREGELNGVLLLVYDATVPVRVPVPLAEQGVLLGVSLLGQVPEELG